MVWATDWEGVSSYEYAGHLQVRHDDNANPVHKTIIISKRLKSLFLYNWLFIHPCAVDFLTACFIL